MLSIMNKLLWLVATILIIGTSVFFTFKLGFSQFKLKEMLKSLKNKKKNQVVTPLQSMLISLGGRVGVGSLSGIAIGIIVGGVGSIFWMWIVSILVSILTFTETILGTKYKKRIRGEIYGGPSYYIYYGLKNYPLACFYSILIIICYMGGFLGIQANTISMSLQQIVVVDKYFIALILSLIVLICIVGGLKEINKIVSKIVPFMTLLYVFITFIIIITNFDKIGTILISIVTSAFNFNSFFGGFISSFIVGMQRGIFATESGLGTCSIASSTTENNSISQGYIQIIGVYITSLIICTATVLIILTSNYQVNIVDLNGIEIIQQAFNYHLSNGSIILFVFVFLFSFSTILTGYYYGVSSFKFLTKKIDSKFLIIPTLIVIFIGSIMSPTILWNIVDMLVAILAIINIYAMLKLRKEIYNEYICYKRVKCDKIK